MNGWSTGLEARTTRVSRRAGSSRVWRMKSRPHIRELNLDSTLWSPDSRDWISDSFSVKLGFRILSLVGFRILDLDYGLHSVKFPRFQILEAKVSPIPESGLPFVEREVLKGDATRYDSQRRFLAQRSVATLLRHCLEYLQHCSNITTLCCVKNRRCESYRVTSP